jgi:hypothetical protein
MKYILPLIISIFLLSACAPDPRNAADARRTDALSAQETLNQAQARAQQAQQAQLQLQQQQALQPVISEAKRRLIVWGTACTILAGGLSILGLGIGSAWAAIASGRAFAIFTHRRATQIPLDPRTGQFPLIPHYLGHGLIALANPNNNSVLLLNTRQPADRQMIEVNRQVILAGLSTRSHKGEMSIIPGGNDGYK